MRGILWNKLQRFDIRIASPINAHGGGNLLTRIGDYLSYSAGTDGVLILFDSDQRCALEVGQELRDSCVSRGTRVPVTLVGAVREYESWFLASLETVFEDRGAFPGNPETVANPKSRLQEFLPGRSYRETRDQASLTARIDLDVASTNSRSFRRLCHAVEELVEAIDAGIITVTPDLG